MAIFTEAKRKAQFVVSEANDWRSRDTVTVTPPSGGLLAGTVLGKITATGKYVAHDAALSNGAEAAAAILFAPIGADETSVTIMARDCEVTDADLDFKSGISASNKTAAIASLAAAGIVVR